MHFWAPVSPLVAGWYSVGILPSDALAFASAWCPRAAQMIHVSPPARAPDAGGVFDAFSRFREGMPLTEATRSSPLPGFVIVAAALAFRARHSQLIFTEESTEDAPPGLAPSTRLVGSAGNGSCEQLPFTADEFVGRMIDEGVVGLDALVDIAKVSELLSSAAHVNALVLDCARVPLVAAAIALLGDRPVPLAVVAQLDRKAVLHTALLNLIRHASRAGEEHGPHPSRHEWREVVAHMLLSLVARATWWMRLAADAHVRFGYDKSELRPEVSRTDGPGSSADGRPVTTSNPEHSGTPRKRRHQPTQEVRVECDRCAGTDHHASECPQYPQPDQTLAAGRPPAGPPRPPPPPRGAHLRISTARAIAENVYTSRAINFPPLFGTRPALAFGNDLDARELPVVHSDHDLVYTVPMPAHTSLRAINLAVSAKCFKENLLEDEWLTGDLVNAASSLMASKCPSDAIVLPHYFFSKLAVNYDYDAARRIALRFGFSANTRRVAFVVNATADDEWRPYYRPRQLSEHEQAAPLPIRTDQPQGDHWLAMYVDILAGTVNLYDPLGRPASPDKARVVCDFFARLTRDPTRAPTQPPYPQFTPRIATGPEQANSFDCAIYAVVYVEAKTLQNDGNLTALAQHPDHAKTIRRRLHVHVAARVRQAAQGTADPGRMNPTSEDIAPPPPHAHGHRRWRARRRP